MKVIKLKESDLQRIVKRVLSEDDILKSDNSKKKGISGIESIEIKTGDSSSNTIPVNNGKITYPSGSLNIKFKGSMIDGGIKGFRMKINSSNNSNFCFDLIPYKIVDSNVKYLDVEISEKVKKDKYGYFMVQPKTIGDDDYTKRYKLEIYDCKNQSESLEMNLKFPR